MLGSYAESEAMTAWDDVFADVPQWFLPVTEFIDTEVPSLSIFLFKKNIQHKVYIFVFLKFR